MAKSGSERARDGGRGGGGGGWWLFVGGDVGGCWFGFVFSVEWQEKEDVWAGEARRHDARRVRNWISSVISCLHAALLHVVHMLQCVYYSTYYIHIQKYRPVHVYMSMCILLYLAIPVASRQGEILPSLGHLHVQ